MNNKKSESQSRPTDSRIWIMNNPLPKERVGTLDFHVETEDYFPSLATLILLVQDSLKESKEAGETPSEYDLDALMKIKEELMHVHENYKLVKKQI